LLRTVEVIIVILILAGAFIAASIFAVLPSPRQISSPDLRQLGLTTLQMLDTDKDLTETVFKDPADPSWIDLEIVLSACLPPNIVHNLTVYDIVTLPDGTVSYQAANSITNSESGIGTDSEAASYLVTSTNVTFMVVPQKISGTLYILNCSDANGWWITGYTSQSLAADLQNLLSIYFETTIMVQNTTDLGRLLDGNKISNFPHENVTNAIILNTFGEAVPIPSSYMGYSEDSYAEYCYVLGQKVNQHNWAWVSIVGYPLYYVSNTVELASSQNSWGIYGMKDVGPRGLSAFLQGLAGKDYNPSSSSINGPFFVASLTTSATYYSNYYGIYPSPYQSSTRSLPDWIIEEYDLAIDTQYGYVFQKWGDWIAGATYNHIGSDGKIHGSLTAIGLTRTPDIRVTALALLMHYHPTLYKSEFTLSAGERPTQRLVVLQLGQQGGS
jgi:hypothetical protein